MSHFTVLVIGENPEAQLAPFHEFECTGRDDEYVQDISILEEKRKEYETKTRKMMRYVGDSSETLAAVGSRTLLSAFDDFFYREPRGEEKKKVGSMGMGWGDGSHWASKDWGDGKGYSTRVHDTNVPGWEEAEMTIKELMTFTEFCLEESEERVVRHNQEPDLKGSHKFGYVKLDANGEVQDVINRTNPNAKWDWYVLGGRWSGFFKLKSEEEMKGLPWKEDQENGLVVIGAGASQVIEEYADRAPICEIDFRGMREDARKEAEQEFDKYWEVAKNFPDAESWPHVCERFGDDNYQEARDFYHNQPCVQALKERKMGVWGCPIGDFGRDRDAYVQRRTNQAASTFAVVKDGKWHERGSMGWWACVSNEKDPEEWAQQMTMLYDDLPPDTIVSMYDCHI